MGCVKAMQATLTEHFIRHGDHLTHVTIVTDPDSLTSRSSDRRISSPER